MTRTVSTFPTRRWLDCLRRRRAPGQGQLNSVISIRRCIYHSRDQGISAFYAGELVLILLGSAVHNKRHCHH